MVGLDSAGRVMPANTIAIERNEAEASMKAMSTVKQSMIDAKFNSTSCELAPPPPTLALDAEHHHPPRIDGIGPTKISSRFDRVAAT
jgi:hypothetical protein